MCAFAGPALGLDENLLNELKRYDVEERARLFISQVETCDEDLLKPGAIAWVRNFETKIIAYLGSGGEGRVYLVDSEQGLACLKIFDWRRDFRNHRKLLRALQPFTPRLRADEERSKCLLFDYSEGVPVDFIEREGDRIGLSPSERKHIVESWDRWSTSLERQEEKILLVEPQLVCCVRNTQNAVYSFRTQEFTLIDPF